MLKAVSFCAFILMVLAISITANHQLHDHSFDIPELTEEQPPLPKKVNESLADSPSKGFWLTVVLYLIVVLLVLTLVFVLILQKFWYCSIEETILGIARRISSLYCPGDSSQHTPINNSEANDNLHITTSIGNSLQCTRDSYSRQSSLTGGPYQENPTYQVINELQHVRGADPLLCLVEETRLSIV